MAGGKKKSYILVKVNEINVNYLIYPTGLIVEFLGSCFKILEKILKCDFSPFLLNKILKLDLNLRKTEKY